MLPFREENTLVLIVISKRILKQAEKEADRNKDRSKPSQFVPCYIGWL